MGRFRLRNRVVEAPEPDAHLPGPRAVQLHARRRRGRSVSGRLPTRADLRRPRGHHRSPHVQGGRARREPLDVVVSLPRPRRRRSGRSSSSASTPLWHSIVLGALKARLRRRALLRDARRRRVDCSDLAHCDARATVRTERTQPPQPKRQRTGTANACDPVEPPPDRRGSEGGAAAGTRSERADARHGGGRHRLHPLHVRDDGSAEGRCPHPRVRPGRCASRPSTGCGARPDDLVWCTAGTGWAKFDLERP